MKAGPYGLILASCEGNLKLVKSLLSAGADKEAKHVVRVGGQVTTLVGGWVF